MKIKRGITAVEFSGVELNTVLAALAHYDGDFAEEFAEDYGLDVLDEEEVEELLDELLDEEQ